MSRRENGIVYVSSTSCRQKSRRVGTTFTFNFQHILCLKIGGYGFRLLGKTKVPFLNGGLAATLHGSKNSSPTLQIEGQVLLGVGPLESKDHLELQNTRTVVVLTSLPSM